MSKADDYRRKAAECMGRRRGSRQKPMHVSRPRQTMGRARTTSRNARPSAQILIFRQANGPIGNFIGLCAIVIVVLSPLLQRFYIERFWTHGRGTVIRLEGGISTDPGARGAWVWTPAIEYHADGRRLTSRISDWQRFQRQTEIFSRRSGERSLRSAVQRRPTLTAAPVAADIGKSVGRHE